MIKTLTGGSTIGYGPTLPDSAFDGTLFFKTGSNAGLYLFGFVQDSNTSQLGDQSAQMWSRVEMGGLYLETTGGLITGDLSMATNGLTFSTNNLSATNVNTPLNFIGNSHFVWKKTNGTELMRLTDSGILQIAVGQTYHNVWHGGNDGAGSGLDADLLDGQSSAFYQNAGNINTGTLDIARFPFAPVQQGGGTNQAGNKIFIGWSGASRLYLQVDSSNFADTWPININGNASTANSANSATNATTAVNATNATNATNAVNATNATNAVEATNASKLRQSGSGSPMTFNYAGQNGQPPWLWGTADGGINNYVYNPANFNVASAVEATNALKLRNGGSAGGGLMAFHWSGQTGQPSWIWGGTDGTNMYVYNPSNFSVAYAASAGTAASATSAGTATTAGYATSAGNASTATTAGSATTAGTANALARNAALTGNTFADRLIVAGGSATYPAFSFIEGADDTGFYSGGDGYINFSCNSQYVGQFQPGGHLFMVGNITAFSDERVKENIEVIPDALAKVQTLRGVTYNRKDNGERATGVIAQDVQKVLPEAVSTQPDDMLGVAYGNMVGLLIESIKELNQKVEMLQEEIQTLRSGK